MPVTVLHKYQGVCVHLGEGGGRNHDALPDVANELMTGSVKLVAGLHGELVAVNRYLHTIVEP